MGIGKRIKEARKLKGLTQIQLADKIGVTPSSITNYENETSHPKEQILYDLMNALSVDANFLFQDALHFSQPSFTPEEQSIIDTYRLLSDTEKKLFKEILHMFTSKIPFGYDQNLHCFVDVDGARAYLKEKGISFTPSFSGTPLCDDDICEIATRTYKKME